MWSAGRTRRRRRRAPSSTAACGAPPRRLGAPATSRCSPSLARNSPDSLDRVDVGRARGGAMVEQGWVGREERFARFPKTLGGGRGGRARSLLAFRGEPNIGGLVEYSACSCLCLLFIPTLKWTWNNVTLRGTYRSTCRTRRRGFRDEFGNLENQRGESGIEPGQLARRFAAFLSVRSRLPRSYMHARTQHLTSQGSSARERTAVMRRAPIILACEPRKKEVNAGGKCGALEIRVLSQLTTGEIAAAHLYGR